MLSESEISDLIKDLNVGNQEHQLKNKKEIKKHMKGQNPRLAVLTCSDSRIIPELIFNKDIGEVFVVRVAGNVTMDVSVIKSLEYAINKLNIKLLLILGHTRCGAIKEAEQTIDGMNKLLDEIRQSFDLDSNHVISNLKNQLDLLPKRSENISQALKNNKIILKGAIYHLEDGRVEFI
jgi:carbonic anhydrase